MTKSDQNPNEQVGGKEQDLPVNVPLGFFNMKLVIMIILALMVWIGIDSYGQFFYGEKNIPSEAWILLGILVVEIVLWTIGLQLWARVWLVGYWWVAVLAHLEFILSIIAAIGALNTQGRVFNGGKAALIFLFILTNIWSLKVLKFFKKSNGKCPLCLGSSCGEPKKNKKWTCPACKRTLIWSRVEV
ncbi:MAG: hypothetical protein ACYS0C_03340 [Planctomycetota bacterium]